jgi:hypothetical protein
MQFSLQTMLAMEALNQELQDSIIIDSIVEQGAFNGYMFTKYFN